MPKKTIIHFRYFRSETKRCDFDTVNRSFSLLVLRFCPFVWNARMAGIYAPRKEKLVKRSKSFRPFHPPTTVRQFELEFIFKTVTKIAVFTQKNNVNRVLCSSTRPIDFLRLLSTSEKNTISNEHKFLFFTLRYLRPVVNDRRVL